MRISKGSKKEYAHKTCAQGRKKERKLSKKRKKIQKEAKYYLGK